MTDSSILRDTAGIASTTLYNGSTAVDADGPVTYTLTRPSGATVASGTATKPGATTGVYQAPVPAQAELTRLKLSMLGAIGGLAFVDESYIDIVGGFYFTLAELRNFDSALTNAVKYPDAKLLAAREEVEAEFEQIMGQSWVARYERERGLSVVDDHIRLKWPVIKAINSLTVDGVDRMDLVTDALIKSDAVDDKRLNFYQLGIYGTIDIEYEHGHDRVPYKVKTAALKRARGILLGQNARIDERATVMSLPDFGTFSLATPGMRGSWVGIPDIDVVLDNYMHGSRKGAF